MGDFFNAELLSDLQGLFQRHTLMSVGWVVVLVLLIVFQVRLMQARIKKATANGAVLMVNREDGVFLDIRAADSFNQSHIANSVNVSAADIKNGKLTKVERYKDKPVILVGKDKYDTGCFNSARVLKKQGFSKLFILDGGLFEWSNNNLPLTNRK